MNSKGTGKLNITGIAKAAGIVLIALIVGASVFFVFKVKIGAREALRDAKNVNMALRSADIEMYGEGKSIYDPSKKNGIANGAKEKADKIFTADGTYSITAYDKARHDLTGMTYRDGKYVVYYEKDGDEIRWDVDYILRVYTFEDTEDTE